MENVRDIVVIGAALGGVTALVKIARSWPADLPATVLVALATPEQPGAIVLQIIESYAPVRVGYALDAEAIGVRRIYLSPAGKHLLVGPGGVLRLDEGSRFDATRPSVNRLFASAASVFGPRVIGIVLSGDSKDGAQGLTDIETAGGIGIVQEPADAVAPRMPLNAIQNDSPHYRARAAEIAPLVRRLMRRPAPA